MTPTVSRTTAFGLVGYAFFVTMIGTTLPTPLYPIYARLFGISPAFITVIFAVYAVGVITSLLLVGRVSDRFGRRPVLLPGLFLSLGSTVIFLFANDSGLLYAGRVLSGLSAGIFTGTATAMLVDLAPGGRRAMASAVAVAVNVGGLAFGTLISGVLAEVGGDSIRLPYAVHIGLLAPAVVAVVVAPETAGGRATQGRFRLQRLRVPPEVRGLFGRAAVVGFCGFAVSGLFGAVAPTFLARLLNVSNHALAGFVVFLVFACTALGQLTTSRMNQRVAFTVGCGAMAFGLGLLAMALIAESLALLIACAVVVGAGQGLVVGSGLAAINTRVSGERRSEAASTYFVVLYVGLVLPVVGAGLAGSALGIRTAGLFFAAAVGAIVVLAMFSLLWMADRTIPSVPAR